MHPQCWERLCLRSEFRLSNCLRGYHEVQSSSCRCGSAILRFRQALLRHACGALRPAQHGVIYRRRTEQRGRVPAPAGRPRLRRRPIRCASAESKGPAHRRSSFGPPIRVFAFPRRIDFHDGVPCLCSSATVRHALFSIAQQSASDSIMACLRWNPIRMVQHGEVLHSTV